MAPIRDREQSMDLHELRRRMEARDKALLSSRSYEEAVKLVREKYQATQQTAEMFVAWQRTIASGGDPNSKSKPYEKWHLKWDENRGEWVKVPQPGEPGYDPEGSRSPGVNTAE
jgi:hypothetical protein